MSVLTASSFSLELYFMRRIVYLADYWYSAFWAASLLACILQYTLLWVFNQNYYWKKYMEINFIIGGNFFWSKLLFKNIWKLIS